MVPSNRNGKKLIHRKFPLKMRNKFFTVLVTNLWKKLPRKGVESPSLQILKNHLDAIQCHVL